MRITHTLLLFFSILFISSIAPTPAVATQTTEIIYQSDFSSDPAWETDQPENFFWQASTSAIYAHIENAPPEYKPNRFFIKETSLDPTKSFTLTAEMKVLDFDVNGVAIFGLYASDYESINQNTVTGLVSDGTVNVKSMSLFGNTGFWDFNIIDKDHNSLGRGGASSDLVLNDWYKILIEYDATTGTLHMYMENKNTQIPWRDITKENVFFSEDMRYLGISMYPDGESGTVMSDPSRLSGSSDFLIDNVLLTQSVPVPEIDPLVLEYAPILYMHEDEDYLPMNVEAFVEGSSLWKEDALNDTQLYDEGSLDFSVFESFINTNQTDDTYLAFSDPDTQRSLDLATSKIKYDELVASGLATTTVYYHKMNDETEDGRQFIVLQYWFFYAMNNWAEHGGRNNHEGDWESVFIFLDADTEEPKYVAYSAHHNDGFAESYNPVQYDSVRRGWSDESVEKDSDRVVSFVSLGSHANYPNNGIQGEHPIAFSPSDETSTVGDSVDAVNSLLPLNSESGGWEVNYNGLWGSNVAGLGTVGPRSPYYIKLLTNSSHRFREPLKWAGIEKGIIEKTIQSGVNSVEFAEQKIKFVFDTTLEAGTVIAINFHEELISFGDNIGEIELLPNFWDISSSLENEAFNTQVSFLYKQDIIDELDINEDQLTAFYFDPVTEVWVQQISEVDTEENEVTFETSHFSRYALGVTTEGPEEELTLEELFSQLSKLVNDSDLRNVHKKTLIGQIVLIEKFSSKKPKVAIVMLRNFNKRIQVFSKLERISKDKSEEIEEALSKVLEEIN